MKLTDLIGDALPAIDLNSIAGKRLARELEQAAKTAAVGEVAKVAARGLVKGIDAFAAAAVKNLGSNDALTLSRAYVDALQEQMRQLSEVIPTYVKLALDVEVHKQSFGDQSPEANAARKRREAGIAEMRAEVKDVLLAATGGAVSD